jgi:hypothetical protein
MAAHPVLLTSDLNILLVMLALRYTLMKCPDVEMRKREMLKS